MTYKILVVDDSKLARMAVAKALNMLRPDWTRVEASNADEALSLAKQSAFDIVIMDFNMPDRDGLHLASDLHALNPQVPLALISANHQKEVVDGATAVGATFLAKPITPDTLGAFLDAAEARLKAKG